MSMAIFVIMNHENLYIITSCVIMSDLGAIYFEFEVIIHSLSLP